MTFTLTGTFTHQDAGATPIVGSPIQIKADPFPLLGLLQTSSKTVPTDANGQISVTLTTGVTGLYYVIRSMASDPLFQPIRFLAPASGTVDISSLVFYNPGSSPVLADILAARDAAIAAAAAVQVGMWAATTAYTSGQTVNAPDGTQIKANSSRTSRASFDATEQTFWTPVATKTGTLMQNALAGVSTSITDMAFGAVADFGTGNTNNATAINAAITAVNAKGGGEVVVPAGTFGTAAAIVMKANVSLRIIGTIKALAAHTGAGVSATNVSNVAIYGTGTIDMNKAATTNGGSSSGQQGIVVDVSTATAQVNVSIRDVTVQNCWQRGIQATASNASSSLSFVDIRDTTVTVTGDDGIYCGANGNTDAVTPSTSHGYWVERNTITTPGKGGITCTGISDFHVERNVVTSAGSPTNHGICIGLGILSNTTDHCTDFTVNRNRVRGFTAAGPKWGIAVSARCTRFEVAGNVCRGNNGGLTIDLTDPNATSNIINGDGMVSGNTCTSGTGSHGIYLNHVTGVQVVGNTCRANAGCGVAVSTSTGVAVTGNTATGNTSVGVALFGTTPAGVGGHTVSGNVSTGNTGGNYYTEVPTVSAFYTNADGSLLAEQANASSTSEVTQYSYTVPARFVQPGTTFKVTTGYMVDNIATSGTLTIRLHGWGGGLTLASFVIPSQAGAATSQQVFAEYLVTIRSVGASGKVVCSGRATSQMSAVNVAVGTLEQTADTTATTPLWVTSQWATSNAGNVCKLETAVVEIVKS